MHAAFIRPGGFQWIYLLDFVMIYISLNAILYRCDEIEEMLTNNHIWAND